LLTVKWIGATINVRTNGSGTSEQGATPIAGEATMTGV
jgi:hypothetical protein